MSLKEFAKSRRPKNREYDPELADWPELTALRAVKKYASESAPEQHTRFSERYLMAPKRKNLKTQPAMGPAYSGKKISRSKLDSNRVAADLQSDSSSQKSDSSHENIVESASDENSQTTECHPFQSDTDAESHTSETQEEANDTVDPNGRNIYDISNQVDKLEDQFCNNNVEETLVKHLIDQDNSLRKKALHTLNQTTVWNNLLNLRIGFQNLLTNVNRLPQCDNFGHFVNAFKTTAAAANPQKIPLHTLKNTLRNSLDDLLHLQRLYVEQNPKTTQLLGNGQISHKNFVRQDVDGEASPTSVEDLWKRVDAHEGPLVSYCGRTIDQVHKKISFASEAFSTKFNAINQPITKQVESSLSNTNKINKKIHLVRGKYRVLGKSNEPTERAIYDEEIYDDGDFYYNLLKGSIESNPDNDENLFETTRRFLALKQARYKKKFNEKKLPYKDKVLRYNEHPQLIAFMVPAQNNFSMADEYITSQLTASLFGKH